MESVVQLKHHVILKVEEAELQRLFLYLIAPHDNPGEQAIEMAEIITMLVNSAGRGGME